MMLKTQEKYYYYYCMCKQVAPRVHSRARETGLAFRDCMDRKKGKNVRTSLVCVCSPHSTLPLSRERKREIGDRETFRSSQRRHREGEQHGARTPPLRTSTRESSVIEMLGAADVDYRSVATVALR